MNDLEKLEAAVEKTKGAAASAVTLIKGAASYIATHKNDPVALQKFADDLNSSAGELGDAVIANPLPE